MASRHDDLVRACFDAWNRDDFDAARGYMHPQIEWRTSGHFPGMEPVYNGPEEVRRWWRALKDPWEYFSIHVERTFDHDAVDVAIVRFEAVGRGSGVKVDLPFVTVWRFEDGLIRWYASYDSLEAAGIADER